MTAGVPGTGIGGLFYMVSALLLPIRGIAKRARGFTVSWRTILFQMGLAAGIIAGIWATGWLLGLIVHPTAAVMMASKTMAQARHHFSNLIRGAALIAGFGTLAAVLGLTQVLRLIFVRKRTSRRPSKASFFLALVLTLLPALGGRQTKAADLLRRADAAFADEDRKTAVELYRQVLALDPFQSRAVYRLGVLAPDDVSALIWFERYIELEPKDAYGHVARGDRLLKLGKPLEAADALETALKLAPQDDDIRSRLGKARLRAAPTFEPLGGGSWDSDLNTVTVFGAAADAAVKGGWRIGGVFKRSKVDDESASAGSTEAAVRVEGRPLPEFSMRGTAGLVWLTLPGVPAWSTPALDLRFRFRPPSPKPSLELRLARSALVYSPLLAANRAVRNEARLGVEVPAGPLRLRGTARLGIIETAVEESNRRIQLDASAAIQIFSGLEISAQVHTLGFSRLTAAGYFAPRAVETLEGGIYATIADGLFSAEVDLGAGMQRLAKQGELFGTWERALRAWAWLALDLAPALHLRFEGEAYSAPYAPLGVSAAPDWKYYSLTAGLQFKLR